MATSDERRKVAEGLRGLCDYHIRYAEQFYEELRGIVMPDLAVSFEAVANTLADLIDPTCEAIEHGRIDESHVFKSCSKCSCGWIEDIHAKPYGYCPNCHARVIEGREGAL